MDLGESLCGGVRLAAELTDDVQAQRDGAAAVQRLVPRAVVLERDVELAAGGADREARPPDRLVAVA